MNPVAGADIVKRLKDMRILSISEVLELTNLSRSTIWRQETSGKFPRRRQLTDRRVGWLSEEIHEWIESREEVAGTSNHPEA
jgi:prophage regulatory protein